MAGHAPVLLQESLRLLVPERGGWFLDATFGGGGHTRALLESSEEVKVLALDRDPAAQERAQELRDTYGERFEFLSVNFSSLDTFHNTNYTDYTFRGALFDLGVSSYQLDQAERGFSFRSDAPLDMRMDTREGAPASEFLETADEQSLVRAVRNYGEERRWKRVVGAIIAARGTGKLQRTASFAQLVCDALGNAGKRSRIHPATLTFQGIRIAVNAELEAVEQALPAVVERLCPGGVLAVISFHSLEDRIVKRFFRRAAGRPEHSLDNSSQMERFAVATMLTRRPVTASDAEVAQNPRSRSAKLRAIQKLTTDSHE